MYVFIEKQLGTEKNRNSFVNILIKLPVPVNG